MVRRSLVALALLALLAALPPAGTARAQSGERRTVTASADCQRVMGETSGLPRVEVTIKNRSGAPVRIGYLRAFGSAPDRADGVTGLAMTAFETSETITVDDGQTQRFEAAWGGVELKRSDEIVALVATSAGLLLPTCDAEEPETLTLPKEAPEDDAAARVEAVTLGAAMIGQLEALRAYPALYALMHADGREAVSFEAMSCWYLPQFGPPVDDETVAIGATTVDEVRFLDWTWGVNGRAYPDAAEVDQTQEIGPVGGNAEASESTIHLVEEDGIWRWFFGSTAEGVAGLSDSCDIPEAV